MYLVILLSLVLVPFFALLLHHEQGHMEDELSRQAVQLAEVVVKSTRHTMLINKRDIAEKIIDDISKQKGVERVRIINADGTIIHSSNNADIGYSVEQKDEPCVSCHRNSEPLEQIPDEKRWRIVTAENGHRSLATMSAIRNERSCATASCHEHKPNQKVLGVVDVAYSLDDVDILRERHFYMLLGFSVCMILVVSISTALLMQRQIYRPLRDLEAGAVKLSDGNMEHEVPVHADDEFGRVAKAFNHMARALTISSAVERNLVETLETKVQERTEALRIAEAEAAQGQKLASVGLLASGIAHELNNPLTGVLTFTSLLRKKTPDGSPDAEDLDLVIRETKRCASIIRRLLDFAREKVPVKGYLNINEVIEETVRFVERQAALQNIAIDLNLDHALTPIWGDGDLIKQVILNIVVNAQQAITDRGKITVTTRFAGLRGQHKPGVEPVPRIEIIVADTGCGIPPANLQRIFDPFFTSKEVGKGTGLGLSVSYGIIRAHRGEITVESTVDAGTSFHIFLPVSAPEETSASKDTEAEQ